MEIKLPTPRFEDLSESPPEQMSVEERRRAKTGQSLFSDREPGRTDGIVDWLRREGGSFAGETGGAVAAGRALMNLPIPHPVVKGGAVLTGSALMAGAGAAGGEAVTQGLESLFDGKYAPTSFSQAYARTLARGSEAAADDLMFSLLFKGGGAIKRAFTPPVRDIDPEMIETAPIEGRARYRSPESEDISMKDVLEELTLRDGGMTIRMVGDPSNWIVGMLGQIESGLRGAIGVPGFAQLDQLNAKAINSWSDDLVRQIAQSSTDNLSRIGRGEAILNAVRMGEELQTMRSRLLFREFDKSLYKETRPGVTIGPMVDVSKMRRMAAEKLSNYADISSPGFDVVESYLRKLSEGKDMLTFGQAQDIRSGLLAALRNAKEALPNVGKGTQNVGIDLGDLAKIVDDSMLEGAKTAQRLTGRKDLIKNFRLINKYHRKGKEYLGASYIQKLLHGEKDPERLGEFLFQDGNVTSVKQLRKNLRWTNENLRAARKDQATQRFEDLVEGREAQGLREMLKRPTLDFKDTWRKIQAGYLEGLLQNARSVPVQNAPATVEGNKLMNLFRDEKTRDTMKEMFNKEQLRELETFARAAQRTQEAAGSQMSHMIRFMQIGSVVGAFLGQSAGGVAEQAGYGALGISFIGIPAIGKVLSNPKLARAAAGVMKVKPSATASELLRDKRYWKALTRFTKDMGRYVLSEEGGKIFGKAAQQYLREQGLDTDMTERQVYNMIMDMASDDTTSGTTSLPSAVMGEPPKINAPSSSSRTPEQATTPSPVPTPPEVTAPRPSIPSANRTPGPQSRMQELFPFDTTSVAASRRGIGGLV